MKANNISQPQRKQTSVVIEGIDTSTPNDIVKDGKCETLMNLRFKDGAWRPVGTYPQKATIPLGNIFSNGIPRIVYQHPAAGEDSYIVEVDREGQYSYYLVYTKDVDNTDITQDRFIGTFDEEMKISHFGKVLFFNGSNSSSPYILNNGGYEYYNKVNAPKVSVDYGEMAPIHPTYSSSDGTNFSTPSTYDDINNPKFYKFWNCFRENGDLVFPTSKNGLWMGEAAFFVAYRLSDGTIAQPSPIGILSTEKAVDKSFEEWGGTQYNIYTKYFSWAKAKIDDETYIGVMSYMIGTPEKSFSSGYFDMPQFHYAAPTLTISIPENLPSPIKGVAVYMTRKYFPFKRLSILTDKNREGGLFSDHKLPEQPFYLVEDIDISKFNKGENAYSIKITEDIINAAPNKPLYSPNNNIHDIQSFNCHKDYNNRLHLADYTTKLRPPQELIGYIGNPEGDTTLNIVSNLVIEENDKQSVSSDLSIDNSELLLATGFNSMLSYHDYRCKSLSFFFTTSKDNNVCTFELKPSVGNNLSYYLPYRSDGSILEHNLLKYPSIKFDNIGRGQMPFKADDTIISSNKVMVSALNNPFSWPFENTYAVGSESSKILALQSAAIEMSDTKFGEMPLYAFTEEGIFALQAGENTLYSSVIPINYDKIINPDVLAINYNLVYITEKGVHILNNQGSVLISSPLNTLDGKPLDVWERVKLLDPQSFNEVICFDAGTQMAYIYNLDLQYWSQRTMQVGDLINKTTGVRINGGNHLIFDITQEGDNNNQIIMIITRPIKLGDLDFKRLETIIPRITGDCNIAFNVEASNDCKEWMALRDITVQSIAQPFTLRRTPLSAKYFRFIITSTISNTPLALTNIDLEWYHKLLRRMR